MAAAHPAAARAAEKVAPTRIEAVAETGGADWSDAQFGKYFDDLGAFAAREALAAEDAVAVERPMYSKGNGVFWASGTNALATKLQ